MSEAAGFLAAILANPKDDLPRLIYADFLDERGDSRGEFIRLGCELAAYPLSKCDSIYPGCEANGDHVVRHNHKCPMYAVTNKHRELLQKSFGAWTESLPELLVTKACPHCINDFPDYETGVAECRQCDATGVVADYDRVGFSRGFVTEIDCSAQEWLANADAITAATPLERVTLAGFPDRDIREDQWPAYSSHEWSRRWPNIEFRPPAFAAYNMHPAQRRFMESTDPPPGLRMGREGGIPNQHLSFGNQRMGNGSRGKPHDAIADPQQ